MASKTEIVNATLTLLGADGVIDPEGAGAEDIAGVYDLVRDATLALHPWNFAMFYASLAAKATAPLAGFARAFALPVEPYCLRVWELPEARGFKWQVQGRDLLTDATAPLTVHCIGRVTDSEIYAPLFVTVFSAHLAAWVTYRRTQDRAKETAAFGRVNDMLPKSTSVDGQEGTARPIIRDAFLRSRL